VELSGQFDEVVTAKPLAIFLTAFILVDLINFLFFRTELRTTILDVNIKLDEFKAIVIIFPAENKSVIRVHTGDCLVVVWSQL
jgi:precorrin-4 methylase